MLKTEVPASADLVQQAAALAPVLRSHSEWEEENRRLHKESLDAMASAGIFRMRVPIRYGGYESDAATVLDVISRLAAADGAAAWNTAVWSISAWMAGQFPDHVQDEVFGADSRVCGVLSPTAAAAPTEGGMVVTGRWQFISGALHSQWQVALAMAPAPDGASQWPVMALIPMQQLGIVDDWHTMGLRGTGSVSTVAEAVFVPADRILPLVPVLQGESASTANADSPVFRSPMIATGCATFTGTAIGLARAAQTAFLERLDRKITYTDYPSQREAPVTHLQLAEAAFKIEEAEGHATRLATLYDRMGATGEPWSVQDRVRSRAYLGRVFQLATEATTILSDASGGSSIYHTAPIQRHLRDLRALSLHALMHPTTNTELYGRILCGLAPNTVYL